MGPESRSTLDGLAAVDGFWRAANYLAAAQIYLRDNPLLRDPLRAEHIKPRLLGHWGTSPGLTLLYAHLSRVVRERDQDLVCVFGPGHGAPAVFACTWLDGTLGEVYPELGHGEPGMRELVRRFALPDGLPTHASAEAPGSIHEGGELGYSLSHATGAAFDNPGLVVACVIGDGEAETGPLAGSWQSGAFLDPVRDGAVLPILHLNGHKIANPTVTGRMRHHELESLLAAHGYLPRFVSGDDPGSVHRALAHELDGALDDIGRVQRQARTGGRPGRPRWPALVLETPKGWTCPETRDGEPLEGTARAHQIPIPDPGTDADDLERLATWLRGYRPDELFDDAGCPRPEITGWLPEREARLGANPHTNGGRLVRDLELPEVEKHAVEVDRPGQHEAGPTRALGPYLAEVIARNPDRFRMFGPDETSSNKLDAVYETTDNAWLGEVRETDEHLAPDGRVMELLSEHTLQGWLEGYLLTGRHGLFASYEAFAHIVDSMVNQHAKWLKTIGELDWRESIASLNYLLTSHTWQQDHNGFSHQDPGFIDLVANKSADLVRVYLPPDANTLLCVVDRCLAGRGRINVVVAGKQPVPAWLPVEEAAAHCERGIGAWEWAGTADHDPDVVLACAGDAPTVETVAAADLLRTHLPRLRVRVVNVVDLMRLQPRSLHPHGLDDEAFDELFTTDRPVIFAYHGYPSLIHRLTYRRTNHANLHVRGYQEEGATTTPFDMLARNGMDRFRLAADAIDRVPGMDPDGDTVRAALAQWRERARVHAHEHGADLPEVQGLP